MRARRETSAQMHNPAIYQNRSDTSSIKSEECLGGQGNDGAGPAVVLREPSRIGSDGSDRAHVIELLRQSHVRWLKNTEVCDILLNYKAYDFPLSVSAPVTPPGERRTHADSRRPISPLRVPRLSFFSFRPRALPWV